MSYDTGASFQPGVGEKARSDARIILEGIKNSVLERRTKDANYVVWQKKIDQGSFTEFHEHRPNLYPNRQRCTRPMTAGGDIDIHAQRVR